MEVMSIHQLLSFFSDSDLLRIQHLSRHFYNSTLPVYLANRQVAIKLDIPKLHDNKNIY